MPDSSTFTEVPDRAAARLHRRALLAGIVSGPALLWGGAAYASTTPTPSPTDTPTYGPTSGPTAGPTFGPTPGPSGTPGDSSTATPPSAPPTSPNGWLVGSPASSIHVSTLGVDGTSVSLPVSNTAAGTVLLYVAQRFHLQVEPLGTGCWGYAYRANVNNTSVWSNHASGTAIDLNAPLHPNGKGGTFSGPQQDVIHAMLADLRGTVRWGGDYHSTKDEMHFEINVSPTSKTLAAVSDDILAGVLVAQPLTSSDSPDSTDSTDGTASTDSPDTDPENPMRNLILAKQPNSSSVWVGDGLGRRQVADVSELVNLQYWMRLKGADPTIYTIADLRILGLPM